MQKSRRWRWMELGLLPMSALLLALACTAERSARDPSDSPGRNLKRHQRAASSKIQPADITLEEDDGVADSELPRGTLVLQVGDSFAGALGPPLGKRFVAAGLRNVVQFKTPSYVPTWAFGHELEQYIARYNPDLVLISLGANEFDIPYPEQRVGAIHRLISTIGGRPCVWVSPPRWKRDTGLLEILRANVAPCQYLDSDALVHDLPRAHDGIHPSMSGREIWADAVYAWLLRARDPHGSKPWSLREQAIVATP